MDKGATIMPYIQEKRRDVLDNHINNSAEIIKSNIGRVYSKESLSQEELLSVCGDINYFVSRLINQVAGEISYGKIAIITGVLDNIKQEFYRRVASGYEDKKIVENGDIKEYQ